MLEAAPCIFSMNIGCTCVLMFSWLMSAVLAVLTILLLEVTTGQGVLTHWLRL